MTIIEPRYLAVSPPRGGEVGASAEGRLVSQRSQAGRQVTEGIDWSSLIEGIPHRPISVTTAPGMADGNALNMLVDNILSHIGHRASSG